MRNWLRNFDRNYLILIILGAVLFIPFLGQVHLFDWDEINFAESAREMILTGDYLTVQINFIPFWEKPPLFIWMQVLSMKMFGITEFAARFPNAICGIVTIAALYGIGKKLVSKNFGLIWTMTYVGSVLPFFYFKSGIIDPWFNLFIFIGIYYFIIYTSIDNEGKKWLQALLSGFFIGLGVLTKGPVAFLIFAITAFVLLIIRKFKVKFSLGHIVLFGLALVVTGGLWFILQIAIGNFTIIADFIEYQIRLFKTKDAGHGGFLLYHFVVLLVGVFPASIFALPAFKKIDGFSPFQRHFRLVMVVLLLTVLILFTIVKTKILHYSSLGYFPLTFLAAWYIYALFSGKINYSKWLTFLIYPFGFLFGIAVIALPLIDRFKEKIIAMDLIRDPFAIGNLQAIVGWTGFEMFIGIFMILGLVAYFFLRKRNVQIAVISLFVTVLVFVNLTLVCVVHRIEGYSQRAAIEFFKSLQGKDVYIQPLRYKSYAHYFYAQKGKPENEFSYDSRWLLTGDIDRDAYFVVKVNRVEKTLEKHPDLEVLYSKNGFVFLKRSSNIHQYDK
jgi:4-amino-4-deoxy-L-arabinose transferase-like glycosyltransferase